MTAVKCSCNGANPNCFKCDGWGYLEQEISVKKEQRYIQEIKSYDFNIPAKKVSPTPASQRLREKWGYDKQNGSIENRPWYDQEGKIKEFNRIAKEKRLNRIAKKKRLNPPDETCSFCSKKVNNMQALISHTFTLHPEKWNIFIEDQSFARYMTENDFEICSICGAPCKDVGIHTSKVHEQR